MASKADFASGVQLTDLNARGPRSEWPGGRHRISTVQPTALFNAWDDAVECAKCGATWCGRGGCYSCTAGRTPGVADCRATRKGFVGVLRTKARLERRLELRIDRGGK
jgi:hypothetical protein